jgi:hypothetical protein
MVHTFKQQLSTAMAMGHRKKDLTGDGVSRELSIGEDKKHKRTNALANGCKCCVKIWR